jgi:hypothetical protein
MTHDPRRIVREALVNGLVALVLFLTMLLVSLCLITRDADAQETQPVQTNPFAIALPPPVPFTFEAPGPIPPVLPPPAPPLACLLVNVDASVLSIRLIDKAHPLLQDATCYVLVREVARGHPHAFPYSLRPESQPVQTWAGPWGNWIGVYPVMRFTTNSASWENIFGGFLKQATGRYVLPPSVTGRDFAFQIAVVYEGGLFLSNCEIART